MDPDIAELIGLDSSDDNGDPPEFDNLFDAEQDVGDLDPVDQGAPRAAGPEIVDLKRGSFPVITQRHGEPKPFFQDKNYYKTALNGEGEAAKRFHAIMTQFLNTKDPQERSMYRGRLIPAYWNLAESIAAKAAGELPLPKQLLLRYGAVLPTVISPQQRQMLSTIIIENTTDEPVHYVDEWMQLVANGQVNPSATDEVKGKKKQGGDMAIVAKLEKAKGQLEVQRGLLAGKLSELDMAESQLKNTVETLLGREESPGFGGLKSGYSDHQRSSLTDINNIVRSLSACDKEVARLYTALSNAVENVESLKEKATDAGHVSALDDEAIQNEFTTVRQMAKMCVGRQGNHLPILMKQYFRANLRDVGTRENVIVELAAVENVDPSVFERTFKRQTNRIVPYVIITPCYGDAGICWEPFERFNRATSRGRIAVPLFPKDLKTAVVSALGDLRWQVAKEKAQHYWMEEGLTGQYFQWFESKKMRGDVKEYFIQDYVLWITKESEGTQKLDREVRGIFWRHMPFPQELKDELRNRGFLYNELYKKDKNREMSDGY